MMAALSSFQAAYTEGSGLFATDKSLAKWSYCTLETIATLESFNLHSSKPNLLLGGELQMLTDDARL